MKALSPRDPKKIGDFTIVSRLGAGGMGDVYLGERDGENVAIKVIRDSFADDASYVARFTREISILQTVSHPNVIGFVDSGLDDGRWWYASEFAHGPSLDVMVKKSGPLSEDAWEVLASGLLAGLKAIHAHNIVHRDIKPANIIMSPYGPKIIDLGVARGDDETSLTNSGMAPGSPAWFSPEQVLGQEVTAASDFFSAGAVLTFAATGRGPWGPPSSVSYENIGTKIFSTPDLSKLSSAQRHTVSALLLPEPVARQEAVGQLSSLNPPSLKTDTFTAASPRPSEKPIVPATSPDKMQTVRRVDTPRTAPAKSPSVSARGAIRHEPPESKEESGQWWENTWGQQARSRQKRDVRVFSTFAVVAAVAAGALLIWNWAGAPSIQRAETADVAPQSKATDPLIIAGEIKMPIPPRSIFDARVDGNPCIPQGRSSPVGEDIRLVSASGELVGKSRVIGYNFSGINPETRETISLLQRIERENIGTVADRGKSCVYSFSFLNPDLSATRFAIQIGTQTSSPWTFTKDELADGPVIVLNRWLGN